MAFRSLAYDFQLIFPDRYIYFLTIEHIWKNHFRDSRAFAPPVNVTLDPELSCAFRCQEDHVATGTEGKPLRSRHGERGTTASRGTSLEPDDENARCGLRRPGVPAWIGGVPTTTSAHRQATSSPMSRRSARSEHPWSSSARGTRRTPRTSRPRPRAALPGGHRVFALDASGSLERGPRRGSAC